MKFVAVHRRLMLEVPAVTATTSALGAWLRLISFASSDEVETPVLRGARAWTDRQWIALANVTVDERDEVVAGGLAAWRDDDLELVGFDHDGLELIEARRRGGKKGGRGRVPSSAPGELQAQQQLSGRSEEPLSSPSLSSPSLSSPSLPPPEGPAPEGENGEHEHFAPGRRGGARVSPSGLWDAETWREQYGVPWSAKYDTALGGGAAAKKATKRLAEVLAELPHEARVAAQERATAMFERFLGEGGPAADASHPWAWFVARFDTLRASPTAAARRGRARRDIEAAAAATDAQLARTRVPPEKIATPEQLAGLREERKNGAAS